MTDTAALITAFMQRHHLTQVGLASHLGVTGPTISRWASGDSSPHTSTLLALALETLDQRLAADLDGNSCS